MRDFEDFAKENSSKVKQNYSDTRLKRNIRIANISLLVILVSLGVILGFTSFFFYIFAVVYLIFLFSGRQTVKRTINTSSKNTPEASAVVSPSETISSYVKVNGPKPSAVAEATDDSADKNYQIKTYKVAGISHYEDNFERLGRENSFFEMTKKEIIDEDMTDERIYEYFFNPRNVELVPEPDNTYDPNAIKVIVDGEHIGYIKSGSCAHLLKVINNNKLGKMSCDMYGGNYICLSSEYDEDNDKEAYSMERDSTPYGAKLEVVEYA